MAPSTRLPFLRLAVASGLLNAFHVLAGAGHSVGSFFSRAGTTYDFHFAALMLVGLDVVAPAVGQLLLVAPLARGERWAWRVSIGLATYQAVAFALLAPFTLGGVASAVTLVLAACLWRSHRRRPAEGAATAARGGRSAG